MPRAGGPRDDTPETIADQQLMFKLERLSRDASRTTRAEQFPQSDEQMDRQDEQIAHDWLITTSANLHNLGRTWQRIMSDTYEFATHRHGSRAYRT
jgi:hypothetical protein